MFELIYTSAPEGLKPGTRGFCTVAATDNLPRPLADRLEALSAYRHHFTSDQTSAGASNPVSHAHWLLSLAGRDYHVLSRVGDSGLDYTQRTNALAHHAVLEATELDPVGPAALVGNASLLGSSWNGAVGALRARRLPATFTPSSLVAHTWASLTSDPGHAALLAQAAVRSPRAPVCVLFSAAQSHLLLPLLAESLALLPPALRWQVTFNTYFTSMPTSAACAWRCTLVNTPAAEAAVRYASGTGGVVLDLTRPGSLPAPQFGELTLAARTGKPPSETPAKVWAPAAGLAQPVIVKAAAPASAPLPTPVPVPMLPAAAMARSVMAQPPVNVPPRLMPETPAAAVTPRESAPAVRVIPTPPVQSRIETPEKVTKSVSAPARKSDKPRALGNVLIGVAALLVVGLTFGVGYFAGHGLPNSVAVVPGNTPPAALTIASQVILVTPPPVAPVPVKVALVQVAPPPVEAIAVAPAQPPAAVDPVVNPAPAPQPLPPAPQVIVVPPQKVAPIAPAPAEMISPKALEVAPFAPVPAPADPSLPRRIAAVMTEDLSNLRTKRTPLLKRGPILRGQLMPSPEECLETLKSGDKTHIATLLPQMRSVRIDSTFQPAIARELEKLLADPGRDMRAMALSALEKWSTKDQVPSLLAVLSVASTDPEAMSSFCDMALLAMGNTKDASQASVMAQFLKSRYTANSAMSALIHLGPAAEDAVIPYVSQPESAQPVCVLLRQIGTAKSLPALRALLNDPSMHDNAQRAIDRIEARGN